MSVTGWFRRWTALVAMALVFVLGPVSSQPVRAGAREHPRLLFTSADIPGLQQKIRDGQGYDDGEYTRMHNYDSNLLFLSGSSLIGAYQGIYNITQLGMGYQLELDSSTYKSQYQQKCQQALGWLATSYGPVANDAHNSSLRLIALSLGFDLCYDDLADGDPVPAERQQIIDEILLYLKPDPNYQTSGTWFDWWSRATPPYTSNKGIILGSSMGLGSIVLRGETDQTAVLDQALAWGHTMVLNNLAAEFDADGAAKEGQLYGSFAMRYLIPYVEARQRYDGVDLSTRGEIRNFGNWLAYSVLPGGYALQANNGNYIYHVLAWNDTWQSWAQTKYSSQLARWVWDYTSEIYDYTYQHDRMAMLLWNQGAATETPAASLPDSMLFRGGFYFFRSGWPGLGESGPGGSIFSFYAYPFGGGHQQEDQGAFSLYSSGGVWFSRDSGYGGVAEESEAHNLVFIDGAGQHNAGSSVGIDASIPNWNLNPFADYLKADLKNAYSTHSPLNDMDYPWPGTDWSWGYSGANPVQKADRHLFAVKPSIEAPEYFILYDDIDKDGNTHTYDWTFHTDWWHSISTSANPVEIAFPSTSKKLKLHFANPTFSSLSFSSETNDFAEDQDLTRLKATVSGVSNPKFLVAMQPVDQGTTPEPVSSQPAGVTGALAAQFAWATATDTVYYKNGATIAHGTLTSDANALFVRRNASGTLTKFQLGQGTTLTDGGTTFVTVTGGSASVASDGTTVSVSDSALQYVVYGPSVTTVNSNHQAVAFTRVGDFVYVNTNAPLSITDGSVAADPGQTSAAITWTTNIAADSQVEYGPTAAYGSSSSLDSAAVTEHAVTLTGLTAGTLYHYRVRSQSGSTVVYSSDGQFTTSALQPDTTPPAAVTDLRVE